MGPHDRRQPLGHVLRLSRRARPTSLTAGGGAIVNVTSVAGLRAWPEDVAYNASKAGVELLTRTIAVEYGARGVRANCLAPGVIDAGMTDAITDPAERERSWRSTRSGDSVAPRRWPRPLSGCCRTRPRFTTGTTLAVDGGFLA